MEKAKLSVSQLFVLMILFIQGDSLLLPVSIEAKQNAWIAILLATVGGVFLFLIYFRLYQFYPDIQPTEYLQKIVGKFLGWGLAFLYMLYFLYFAARMLRVFGDMLVTFAYRDTPLFIVNALMIIVVVYTVRKGIEVLARTGELLFVIILFLGVSGLILLIVSGLIDLHHLKPIFEEGISPVLKVAFTQTLIFLLGK